MAITDRTIDYTRPATHVAQFNGLCGSNFEAVPLLVAAWRNLVAIEQRQKSIGTEHPDWLMLQNQQSLFSDIILTFPANTVAEAAVKLKYLYFMISEIKYDPRSMDDDINPGTLVGEDPSIAALALLSANLRQMSA